MALIAQMVIKNEADRYLVPVLDNLSDLVDKIVITDDGSTDNSVQIAGLYTDLVYENKDSLFEVHEGSLRQNAWNNLSNHAEENDWILCIDADEIIDVSRLRAPMERWLTQTRFDVLGIRFYHMWNELQYRADKAWKPNVGTRLFRFKKNGVFKDSKLACGSEPGYIQQMIRANRFHPRPGFDIKHLGYAKDEDKQMKYDRYMKIDQGDFHSLAHIKSILDPNPILINWDDRI